MAGWSCFSLLVVSSWKAGALCNLSLHFLVLSLQRDTQVPTNTWHWIEFSFPIGCGASQSDRVFFSSDISKCGTNYCSSARQSFQPNRVSWGLRARREAGLAHGGFSREPHFSSSWSPNPFQPKDTLLGDPKQRHRCHKPGDWLDLLCGLVHLLLPTGDRELEAEKVIIWCAFPRGSR